MPGQDARLWQHERLAISAVAEVLRAPSRDPANDLQAMFQRHWCHGASSVPRSREAVISSKLGLNHQI